uniref:Uncharacterized protein n=1 Tax=Strix occidentalis caurina TaxID=311401 RepID=A0A8D0FDZ7_STROC
IPKSRALARAMRRLAKALKRARGSQAAHQSSQVLTELSPFFGIAGFLGKRISLERYSFSLCTLACRDSVDLLRRRGSTEIPIVRANFLLMPSSVLTLSSSRLKPLPARTFLWYLIRPRGKPGRGHSPPDLAGGLVEPCGHSSLPVLVEVGLQDHAIAAGRHGCCGLRTRAGLRAAAGKSPHHCGDKGATGERTPCRTSSPHHQGRREALLQPDRAVRLGWGLSGHRQSSE